MKDKKFTVSLKCLFCDSTLEGDSENEYNSGDLIECQECKELNDYDSLIEVASEEGKELVGEYAKEEISKIVKKLF